MGPDGGESRWRTALRTVRLVSAFRRPEAGAQGERESCKPWDAKDDAPSCGGRQLSVLEGEPGALNDAALAPGSA